jgi:hypothetical protein
MKLFTLPPSLPSISRAGWVASAALTASLAAALAPQTAEACGGTFCDNGPQVMPVDQTGETILFSLFEGTVEAHIQIGYTGDPERFAWLIPVMNVPELSAGSQFLFSNLLNSTVPTFNLGFQPSPNGCGVPIGIGCGGAVGSSDLAGEAADSGGGQEEFDSDGDVDVLDRGFAGAFEYAVLSGTNVDEITSWLDANGYAQDDDAPPILEEYLDDGFLFVAVKLRSGAGVDEIHPLVVTYEGDEPCVPIRLTRIAAAEDMPIRAFFLGEDRVVPTNFSHVVMNDVAYDWVPNPGSDYNDAISRAVDEAGGHAFVTEYAGASDVVVQAGILDERWDVERFQQLEAVEVYAELVSQNLGQCFDGQGCAWNHPLLQPLLDDFLPVPDGVEAGAFYGCLSCYQDQIDPSLWDGPTFAAEFDARIVAPAVHSLELLNRHDYVTRLYTTISPHEMTRDPIFHENPDMPDVTAQVASTRLGNCAGADWIEFADGRQIALEDNFSYPTLEEMPYAARVEEIPARGAPVVVTDNAETIDLLLADHNDQFVFNSEDDSPPDERDLFLCSARKIKRHGEGVFYLSVIFAIAWRRRRH